MPRLLMLAPVLLLCAAAAIRPADAQSFNCRYAHYADEAAICAQPDLSRLDERLAAVFGRVNATLPPAERVRLRQLEDRWVVARRQCGRDHDCIEHAYLSRIEQLSAGLPAERPVAALPSPPPAPAAASSRAAPPMPRADQIPARSAVPQSPRQATRRPVEPASTAAPSPEPAQASGTSTPPRPAPVAPPPAAAGPSSTAPTITWVDPPTR